MIEYLICMNWDLALLPLFLLFTKRKTNSNKPWYAIWILLYSWSNISSPNFFLYSFMWWYECMKHLWYDFLYNSMYSWSINLITQLIPLDTPNVMKWNYAWNTNGEKFWSCMVGYNLTNWYHHDMKHLWFAMMHAILVLSNYDVMYCIWCKSWWVLSYTFWEEIAILKH